MSELIQVLEYVQKEGQRLYDLMYAEFGHDSEKYWSYQGGYTTCRLLEIYLNNLIDSNLEAMAKERGEE